MARQLCRYCGDPTDNDYGAHGACLIQEPKTCEHPKGVWCACKKYREPLDVDRYYESEQDESPYRDVG